MYPELQADINDCNPGDGEVQGLSQDLDNI